MCRFQVTPHPGAVEPSRRDGADGLRKPVSDLVLLIIVVLFSTTVPVDGVPAQEAAHDPEPAADGLSSGIVHEGAEIDGFWDVPWGADSAAVAEELGPPIVVGRRGGVPEVEEAEAGGTGAPELRTFVYTVFLLGRDGFLHLWLLEGEGLVGGVYQPVVEDCSYMLRRMVALVKERHPDVPFSTRGGVRDQARGRNVCQAAMEGMADFAVVWEDGDGNQIRVGAEPGAKGIRMTASTPALRAWERRTGEEGMLQPEVTGDLDPEAEPDP